ncbi:DUF7504 family protein [Haloarchaeobius sp. TZWWS8]|uniref:DUF7504 family protein n=1 Tax=Haloarchaeobius sp. TZWWS8 TaxID=3446121 RepID=UPI003EBEFB4E
MNDIDAIGDTGNVLLTAVADDCHYCSELLDAVPAENRAELTVSFPKAQAETTGFGSHSATQPAKKGIVSVGDVLRSTAQSGTDFDAPVPMDAVESPGDLQSIGTAISRFCERWDADGYDIVVCFDSLSELLEHAGVDVVFQFCHVLNSRLASVGALAHFHLDTARHADQTVATFQSIYDDTVGETTDADALSEFVEATDDDIAALTDGWGEEANYSIVGDGELGRPDEIREASDEDIADRLETELLDV